MRNEFSDFELKKISVVVEDNDYMLKQGNCSTILIFGYETDNYPSFVLVKSNDLYNLTKYETNGTVEIVCRQESFETAISLFEAATYE